MKENYYAVIMAGGGGTRLWPLSRKNNPKQLLAFISEKSLFEMAIERLEGVFSLDHIKVVTTEELVPLLRKEAPELEMAQFIIEPSPKGTAAVVGLAAVVLRAINPDAVMAVLTADHIIGNINEFHYLLEKGYQQAISGSLVTLGIKPEYPSTAYGYIKVGKKLDNERIYLAEKFVEKPDLETATAYVESGQYYWNSGMFIWRADRILEEISEYMPNLRHTLMKIEMDFNKPDFKSNIADYWKEITPQTIDYGVMEKAKGVIILKAEHLEWNDVGSWDSLVDILPTDEQSNVVKAENKLLLNCKNLIVLEENDKKIISGINLENLVIIDTKDALLVCRKGESQLVRRIIEELQRRNYDQFL